MLAKLATLGRRCQGSQASSTETVHQYGEMLRARDPAASVVRPAEPGSARREPAAQIVSES